MFVTNHLLAGTIIGLAWPQRAIPAFGAGLVSHVVMDVTPHFGDEALTADEFFVVCRRDGLVGIAVLAGAVLASPGARRGVVAGIAGAVLLDLDKPVERFFGFNPFPRWLHRFHGWIQNEEPHRVPHEIAAGTGLAAAAAGGLWWRRRAA
ncbi:MAG TPA: hypothetical protein VFF40_05740 [Acidimicrobiia bacterium]|nr:hypothetical protein [Acidimicrobiia bacterium]